MISQYKKESIANTKSFISSTRLFERAGVFVAILLAAILGNYVAHLATRQIHNTLTIYVAGVLIGLLVGIVTGIYVKRIWRRLLPAPQEETQQKTS